MYLHMLSEKLLHNQYCNIQERKSFLSFLQNMDFMGFLQDKLCNVEGYKH